jgi:hypothetical protein
MKIQSPDRAVMNNEIELVKDISDYYRKSQTVLNEFGGPSVYFHVQAIKQQRLDFMSERHIEMIYATLASWGMHRMGDPERTKTKIVEYDAFTQSLVRQRKRLFEFCELKMDECTEEQYRSYLDGLKDVYMDLVVSESNSTLVAHSKTLAHILPHLIPPIDRQYTVRFFTQDDKQFFTQSGNLKNVNLPKDCETQFNIFKDYCLRIKRMFGQCDKQLFEINPDTFNTSYSKIMDNVIMAFVKCGLK